MAKQATLPPDRYANRNAPPPIGHGWVAFAGSYLMLAGLLNLIWGVNALSNKDYFHEGGLLWTSLDAWGGLAVLVAVVQLVAGGLVFARKLGGVLMAIVLAMVGILMNFLSIGAYPVWSVIAMSCNALVLWAVTVHSDQFET